MRPFLILLAVAALLCVGQADAAARPSPGAVDPRVKVAFYEPGQVYEIAGTLHYQMALEFGDGERIENVGIGDALSWQVTPNRKADLLFLKPLTAGGRTNMTVITNLRRYSFSLTASAKAPRDLTYGVRFVYPEPARVELLPPPPPEPPRDLNHAYTFSGSAQSLPIRVFDDGRATYFAFAAGSDYPAIYVVDAAGHEALSNVAFRDGFLVIDELAPGFALRRGTEVTWILNGGFRPPEGGGLAPAPSKPRTGGRR